MQTWRLLDFEYPDAPSNLAFEEALARQVGNGKSSPTLRLWRNPKAAVIGENQSAEFELQLDTCRELGVEVVRRFTGGGAVYHDLGNLNYSVCTPKPSHSNLEFQNLVSRQALDCVVICLRRLGLDSTVVPVNTIIVHGRKISGGAGAIRWGSIFYHGSILANTDLEMVWKVLRLQQTTARAKFVQSTRAPVTSLERELGRDISIDRVKRSLSDAFAETFKARLVAGPATGQELNAVSGLVKEKYGNNEWNLKM
jgi:lipoate-protein ligase A